MTCSFTDVSTNILLLCTGNESGMVQESHCGAIFSFNFLRVLCSV